MTPNVPKRILKLLCVTGTQRTLQILFFKITDVLYHLLVMLAARDVSLEDVLGELERREGMSGIAEKANR